ncbi:cytochrome C biogenesis protein [Flavobacterium arcticum]|uniref:Cytochrome C biogenesis protein n=1 Tax=Flavobacterium arcticum TaxID=1784713 RepID=A0A345HDM6_9FLAO|nr:cytochrome c biogenesis protein CcsA [Flavobacterium arcticum]AXG74686.1 cytochrome C biogenesis protein [Flavobacterium arcticum]KAF2512187.1 cytochrome c biogenesis protein CcsA [Flavobacterium arcticum]
MDKIISFFSSTRLMATLFIVFAAAMGIGTFIEDAYNTDTARIFIYNAWWFEAIMLIFVINFFGNMKRYQLHKKEKWATLLLHLSFILIIIGAFVTRYISFEGMMPIREGATENVFYSDRTYLTAFVDGEYEGEMRRKTFTKQLLLSPVANNNFTVSDEFNTIPFEISYKDFTLGAKEVVKEDPAGQFYIKLVEAGDGGRHEHYLKGGEVQSIHNILFALNKPTDGAINITTDGKDYTIKAPFEGDFMRMADQFKGAFVKDSVQPLMMRSLYSMAGTRFVFPEPAIKGKIVYESNNDYKTKEDNALTVTVKSEGQEKEVVLLGKKGKMGIPQAFKIGDLEYTLMYGSKIHELPFAIKLDDFIAKKYPGTESSYASFESKTTVIDNEDNKTFDAHIYMNHVLDYKGYRFFQSSFDPDEKGTVLSVNHDFWGTWITYIGYFLLYFGLMAILFDKNTRFNDLKKKLDKVKAKRAALTISLLFLGFTGYSQEHSHSQQPSIKQIDSLIQHYKVSEEHAAKFGRVIIQDAGGRMKPVNTFSSELLRKVSKSDTYKDMNADQVFLSMAMFDQAWYNVPIIYMKRGNDSLRKVAGLDKTVKYAALANFFDGQGNYKLSGILDEAYREPVPNQFQKDFMDIDRKINLLYSALTGQILKIFPIPNDENNKWVSYLEADQYKGTTLDTIKNVLPVYLQSLSKATKDNDYELSDSFLQGLSDYQHKYGGKIMPSDDKVEAEILYNKYDIFKKLFSWYMYAGLLMFIFVIVKIFNTQKWVTTGVKTFHIIIGLLFALHTAGLIARWYISGHAPWSNAYESVIYVGWATMFFGLAFGRKSELTVAATAFVAAMVLMVAHWNWTDPEIGNLVPVLNSYWLMIHVAVIVGSYGPFTLGMILGLVALILMLFTNKNNKQKMDLTIKELTYINEMALTVGLVMLTIGNFLGGQWANESWGRYWGWDPKETWALVSIMVYAFVIHMRFVPKLRGTWVYNFFSVLAFASILMTYFGVNFYLTGLHSYASGEVRTPMYFLWMGLLVFILGIFSFIQYKKHLKK